MGNGAEWDNPELKPGRPKKVEPYDHTPVVVRELRRVLPEEDFDISPKPATFDSTVTRKGDGIQITVGKAEIYSVAPEDLRKLIDTKFQEAIDGTGTF